MLKSTSVESKVGVEAELTREQALVRLAIGDYVMLTKPRIILLLLVITFVPMFLAAPGADEAEGVPGGMSVGPDMDDRDGKRAF